MFKYKAFTEIWGWWGLYIHSRTTGHLNKQQSKKPSPWSMRGPVLTTKAVSRVRIQVCQNSSPQHRWHEIPAVRPSVPRGHVHRVCEVSTCKVTAVKHLCRHLRRHGLPASVWQLAWCFWLWKGKSFLKVFTCVCEEGRGRKACYPNR